MFAGDLVIENRFAYFVDGGFGNRPSEVVESAQRAQIVQSGGGAGKNNSQVREQCAPSRCGKEEKEKRPRAEQNKVQVERRIDDRPVEILSPENPANREAAQPRTGISHRA